MSQRERGIRIQQLVLKIIKQVIEEKASRLETKGFTTISSREVYKHCLREFGDEDRCIGITTYAARLLNRYAERLNSYRTKWRIVPTLLKKLFNIDANYKDLKDTPLNNLNDIQFLYIVTALLEAKPEGEEDGYRG
jgi:hypothetical protein